MIDRQQLLWPLRRRTLMAATGVSAAAWIACPLVALLILLVACLSYTVIEIVFLVVVVVGFVALVAGVVAAVVGLFAANENPGIFFGGIIAAAIGLALSHVAPKLNVGSEVFVAIVTPAQDLVGWFVEHNWCIWAWIPAAFVAAVAAVTWLLIILLRHIPEELRHIRRAFYDCPFCHHRGSPVHVCPNCGSSECDLRSSGYGVFFAHCQKCRNRLPTLDLLGRHRLRRRCGHCDSAWSNPHLGRLPVWHLAVIRTGGQLAPKTTVAKVRSRLLFVHESTVEHTADTAHASVLAYLNLLDQVLVVGNEPSLARSGRLLPGVLGVLERATTADVRKRARLPVVLVQHATGQLRPSAPTKDCAGTTLWKSALATSFRNTSTYAGEVNAGALASLL